jgi:endonuclease III
VPPLGGGMEINMEKNIVLSVKKYLEDTGIIDIDNEVSKMDLRAQGKEFSLSEHIEGMVYSLLSAQTVWANIEHNMFGIRKLFCNFNAEEIKQHDFSYFVDGLAKLRCRSRLTNNQMKALHGNIATMEHIVNEYGSMDKFVTSRPQQEIVKLLSKAGSKYKLRQMGEALVWEYLRNVGVDGAKPDVHMKRILGCDRLGVSKFEEATNEEVIKAMKELSVETGLWMAQLDYIFWCYCATDKGEICTVNPNCSRCVIRRYCKHGKNDK